MVNHSFMLAVLGRQ